MLIDWFMYWGLIFGSLLVFSLFALFIFKKAGVEQR